TLVQGTVHDSRNDENVPYLRVQPASPKDAAPIAVWLSDHSRGNLFADGSRLTPAAQKLIDAGVTIVSPSLYLAGLNQQPMNPVRNAEPFRRSASYTYGYNHPLLVHRVHDAMNVVAALRKEAGAKPVKIILVGSDGAGL